MASSAGNKRHKVTANNSEGGYKESSNNKVREKIDNLFVDSDSDKSTINNMVTDKGDTKTGSDNKRKADNDDDNDDYGKKQKGDD